MSKNLKKSIQIARRNQHITPKVNTWLLRNPSGIQIHNPEVAARVAEMMRPEIGKTRAGAFHPSQLYQCKRAQVFGYFDVPTLKQHNPTLLNLFNDGHFRHLRWQIMLLSAGVLTDVEVPIAIPELRLTGSMDGMNRDEGWMFELKGTSQLKAVQQRGAMKAHVKQVNAYLLASGLERAIIVYECKTSQDWVEIEVKRDRETVEEITTILEELNAAIDNNVLPEVLHDCKNQEGNEFANCPYAHTCLGVKRTTDIAKGVQVRGRSAVAKRASRRD